MATMAVNTLNDTHKISPWCVAKDPHFSRQSTAASDDDGSALTELQQAAFTKNLEDRPLSVTSENLVRLQYLVNEMKVHRALDVGSLYGATSLALAEVLPDDGDVQALESDQAAVEFGMQFISKAPAGIKVTTNIGNPLDLIAQFAEERVEPFDFVLINSSADMRKCFELIWEAPGFLSASGMVCIDMNHVEEKDQVCEIWGSVMTSLDKVALEIGGLLIVQRSSYA